MQSEQYQKITKVVAKQQEQRETEKRYLNKKKEWKKSPFSWLVKGTMSRRKGKIGEEIVKEILEKQFEVSDSQGTDYDMMVNDYKVEVKFSTLWGTGIYGFHQIRDQDYDILFCLGVSPHGAHAWVARKKDIPLHKTPQQHGGVKGKGNTWWIKFKPDKCCYDWLKPHDGDLSKVCKELEKLLKKKKKKKTGKNT